MSDVTAVIGDIVGSRTFPDRGELHRRVASALESAPGAIQPLTLTIGDEFQGIFQSVRTALRATLVVQLHLLPDVELRFGVGVGEVLVMADRRPFGQDGSAWWSAREAIDEIRQGERSYRTPRTRATGLRVEGGTDALSSYLVLRDHLLAGFDRVDADIVLGLMQGETQAAIADRLGLDRGAVSRRVGKHGLSALLWAEHNLGSAT